MRKPEDFFFLLFHVLCFLLMGCQVDSGLKKHSLPKQTVNQFVESHYNPSVDILFIIDNSESMKNVQSLLAKNAELFIDQFLDTEFVDYHIAVTSSSTREEYDENNYSHPDHDSQRSVPPKPSPKPKISMGSLARCNELAGEQNYNYSNYVDRKTPKNDECLMEMMKVGIDGYIKEDFLSIPMLTLVESALTRHHFSFYRPEAHLAIFVITDTHDQSGFSIEKSYGFLLDLKKGDKNKIHYAIGIITFQVFQYSCMRDRDVIPHKLMEMVELFGPRGFQFELCQFDYGKSLAHFANHLIESVLTVPLDFLPDVSTIEVYYDHKGGSQRIPNGANGWAYNTGSNAIRLSRDVHLEQTGGQFNIKYKPFYVPGEELNR